MIFERFKKYFKESNVHYVCTFSHTCRLYQHTLYLRTEKHTSHEFKYRFILYTNISSSLHRTQTN